MVLFFFVSIVFSCSLYVCIDNRRVDATHIFDGLNDFPTHVAHIRFGKLVTPPTPWPFTPHDLSIDALLNSVSPLYSLALHWLKEDREYRRELENLDMKKTRGPKNQVCFILTSVTHPLA